MRLLVNTDHIEAGFVRDFATYMNLYDDTFAARYLRKGVEWRGVTSKTLQPEAHYEADKYDIYYLEVKDVEGFLLTCKAIPQCLIVAEVDAQYKVVGDPLHVSEDMLRNKFFQSVRGAFVVPNNLMTRPSTFVPRPLDPACLPK